MVKKTFLLLEVLIAIFIVSMCLVPLIQNPIQSFRAELRLLEEMEGERLADWTFSEIKEKLLKNEIPWEKLPAQGIKTSPFTLPCASIFISNGKSKKIERSFTLECGKRGEKEGFGGETYRIIKANVSFKPPLSKKNQYLFSIMVRKIPKNSLDRK